MATAANHEAYGNPAWNAPPPGSQNPWGSPGWQQGPGWGYAPYWHPAGIPRWLGIAMMIVGFMVFWPIGLAVLIAMIWSGRMGCFGRRRWAAYQMGGWQAPGGNPGPAGAGPANGPWGGGSPWAAWKSWCSPQPSAPPSSGNRAFDEYRAETLRRLEDEQKEFGAFLERLRFAKDKAEFDQFMAERRPRPPAPPEEPPQAA
jgi:hypothetical protein